jgi:hypothetical protein
MLRKRRGRKAQVTQKKNWKNVLIQFNKTKCAFAAAVRGHTDQKIHQGAAQSASTSCPELSKIKQQETGQSVPASSETSDNMLRAVTIAQQIMTEVKSAVSEQAKIFAITKTVFSLMKDDGK